MSIQESYQRQNTTLENIKQIPRVPGVYLFYNQKNHLLYIGKSISLRARIQSHLLSVKTSSKEKRLMEQTTRIEWEETAGEVGALLREATLIKQYQPIYNRRLRKTRILYALQLSENEKKYLMVKIVKLTNIEPQEINSLYGLSRSQRQLIKKILDYAKKWSLCTKLLSLEKGKGPCFSFQIKSCKGACVNLEEPELYNKRLLLAFEEMRVQSWPFESKILIKEKSADASKIDYYVVDRWCYLFLKEREGLVGLEKSDFLLQFDLDVYKILVKCLFSKAFNIEIIKEIKEIRELEV